MRGTKLGTGKGVMTSPIQMAPGVSVRGLRKSYGSIVAVQGLDLEVGQGNIFGLLGPNGAGKTTTLECIMGLRRPDAGSIALGGVDLLANPLAARKLMGAVLQETALQEKITPRMALSYFGSFYPHATPASELLARFGLEDKADVSFDSLSGGQQQRLFLALAFVNKPHTLILDEPGVGLDPKARRELHELLRSLRDEGCTLLLSTHQIDEAESLCDVVAILDHGQLVAQGSPAQLAAAAGKAGRIRLRIFPSLPEQVLAALPGVRRHRHEEDFCIIESSDARSTVAALMAALDTAGSKLGELHVGGPTLEDAFLDLTGHAWERDDGEMEDVDLP